MTPAELPELAPDRRAAAARAGAIVRAELDRHIETGTDVRELAGLVVRAADGREAVHVDRRRVVAVLLELVGQRVVAAAVREMPSPGACWLVIVDQGRAAFMEARCTP